MKHGIVNAALAPGKAGAGAGSARYGEADALAPGAPTMLQKHSLPIARIRVPAKRRRALDPAKVEALAADMLENGQTTPISCRVDPDARAEDGGQGYILVEGLHRLEAARALGEESVVAYLTQARIR